MIDFGPYPLHKDWLLKKKERKEGHVLMKQSLNKGRKDSKNIYLMPDRETDRTIGNKCLIIDYSKPKLNINHSEQFTTPFCKNFRLEQPLQNLEERLDSLVSRYKRRYYRIEVQSMLLLIIGIIMTTIACIVISQTVGMPIAVAVFAIYLLLLGIVLARNNTRMHQLMQSYIIGISTILYLENQNIFHPIGVRVSMGHLGNWLEVRKYKSRHTVKDDNPYRMMLNNGLSTGTFRISKNKLFVTHEPSVAATS